MSPKKQEWKYENDHSITVTCDNNASSQSTYDFVNEIVET